MPVRPKAPTRTALSRDYILRSALYLIDEQGLSALSLRALGRQMGVSQTAIYRHIHSKADLLDGVVELIWQSATALDDLPAGIGWKEGLETAMLQVYRTLLDHPNAIALMATHPIDTEQSHTMVEGWLDLLGAHGLEVDKSTMHLFNSLAGLTIGCAIAEAEPPAGGAGGETRPAARAQLDHTGLSAFVSALDGTDSIMETSYRQGLHALITGWPDRRQKD
ncbi:TetR/AcrR family transcriptional regulator [Bifidobacterium xylocopae]|uniref:HTH tetR-type domain-containing protein n=2 Tax=Bifidobacterium TaxID=1678 RepID=A0A366KE41_9BIFI|nr:TetR family transcriptional regulator [Bifidobacterium xylocopae]RBP99995.1 hypothetical protein CRD59_00570 [Bifidobacterium xylocopae]